MLRADDLQPADLWRVIWSRRWRALGVGLMLGAIAYGYALFEPDVYTANTLVLVEDFELPREYVSQTSTLALRNRLNTLSEQVLSRTAIEHIVEEFDLHAVPGDRTPREERVDRVRTHIGVDVIDTEGFRISFTHVDPKLAARIANELADRFILENTDALTRQAENTTQQIRTQLDTVGRQVRDMEAQIRAFKAANLGTLPQGLPSTLDALTDRRTRLRVSESRASATRARIARLEGAATTSTPVLHGRESARATAQRLLSNRDITDPAAILADQPGPIRLEGMRIQRESLLRRFTVRHPDVRTLDLAIAELEREVAAAPIGSALADPGSATTAAEADELYSLRAELNDAERESVSLRREIADLELRVAQSPAVEQELRGLERERDSLDTQYADLVGRGMEAELATSMQGSGSPFASFRVIDRAVVPQVPTGPQRVFFLLGGLIVGVGLVFGSTLAFEMIIEPIRSGEELSRHGSIEVLASLPLVETKGSRRTRRVRQWASIATVGGVLAVVFVLRLIMRPM